RDLILQLSKSSIYSTKPLVTSQGQENLFITRWLAAAKRQRRFSRDVAQDIDGLLQLSRTAGMSAGLYMKLDYLWRSCTGNLKQQSDLFRLTYAMETAKENRRVYRLLSDSEWQGRNKLKLDPELNGIYLLKASLNTGFDGEGNQTGPLKVKITGNVAGLMIFLDTCDWQAVPEEECWYLAARN
ncbi:DUF2913 family protein, partial [Klebsiella pneumoniae]